MVTPGVKTQKAPPVRAPEPGQSFTRALEECKESEFIAEYSIKNGEMDPLSGVLEITPGQQALELLKSRQIPRPRWIPATSGDLERWLKETGYTSAKAAQLLGITRRNITKFRTRSPEQPLSPEFRRALRHFLWGAPK